MAAFHVFVEGATDPSPGGLAKLAEAIANHYGLPAADLLGRLQRGRFRVKGNIDRATAETYVRDLQRLGARCVIEEANAENSQRTTPIPFPAVRPPASTPPAGTALPPRASTPPPVAGQFQSGLSAAFSGEMPAADLGALGRTGAQISISSIDGVDDTSGASPDGSFGPPPGAGGLPASIGPAPEKPTSGKVPKAERPKDVPVDMFAPPEMQGEEFKVELAADDRPVERRASTPPPIADEAAPAGRKSQPSMQPPTRAQSSPSMQPPTRAQSSPSIPVPNARQSQPSMAAQEAPAGVVAPSRFGPLGDERNRFIAGVFLAVLLGFVPAHFVAKMKEESAYAQIDRKVIAAQQAADTPDTYATLDRMRADQLDRKQGEKRNAAIIGFAIWALVGAAIAFVWFKKIPWDA